MKASRPLFLCVAMALLVVSCQAPPMPAQTPPVGSVASTTLAPPAAVDVTVQAAKGKFRGPDECQSGPEFELTYALDKWNLQDSSLVQRASPDCRLLLAAHGRQVSGPKLQQRKVIAGYSWQVSHFPNEGLSSYWLEVEGGCYLFIVRYAPRTSAKTVKQCQQAAEAVIDSFRLAKK